MDFSDVKYNSIVYISEDAVIGGVKYPARSNFITNLYAVSRDPKYFKFTEVFEPRNFLNEKGEFVPIDANIPFGAGRRICLAEILARTEIFVFFATLLKFFNWKFPTNEAKKYQVDANFLRMLKPYEICATKRFS